MGQTASVKFSKFVGCSRPVVEEQEEFRPHHPRFMGVTAEVPNSKPASLLQPNRYSESNRSFQSFAKDPFVLDPVSPLPPASVEVKVPVLGGRHFWHRITQDQPKTDRETF